MRVKVVLVLMMAALLVSMADARRRKNRNRQKNKDLKCKYGRPITKSECVNGTMTKTFSLKRQNAYNNCTDTKSIDRPCRMKMRCKYSVSKGDCDPTTQRRTKTYILKDGSDSNCNPTFTKEKPCRVKDKCKYKPTRNSVCDDNGMIELERKSGSDPNACAPTKQVKCSEKMIRKMQRKKNKMNKKERRKNRKERRQNRAKAKCRYSPGPWTQCDITTDTMSRTMTLDQGDPDECEETKILKRKCRKQCRYKRGSWSSCNPKTSLMVRTDVLKSKSADFCEQNRTITKKCGGKGKRKNRKTKSRRCKYQRGTWSECDNVTQKRRKVNKLVSGDPKRCKPEKVIQRACARPDGRDRCFFGKWQDWEVCQNGVQKKQRPVLQGGMECQRRGVKTRPCNS